MSLLPIALALAGDGPTRCTAKWTGPAKSCAVRGSWEVQATASTPKGAERAVKKELVKVLQLEAAAIRARVTAMTEGEFGACEAAIDTAFVNCFPEPELAEEKLCFVELKVGECWNGDLLNFEDVGWHALEEGRRRMCEAVDKHLVAQSYTDVELRRTECRAKCESLTTVKCP
ncbi:MAG: hypothetical protein ACOZNI_07560 [Myxococcota bacterium]